MSCTLRVRLSPDQKDNDKAEHTKGLNAQTADAAAAQCYLNGLADGAGGPCLVSGAHVGVSRATHTQDADSTAHAGAQEKCETAERLNKKRKNKSQNQNHDRYGFEFCFQEHGSTTANDAGHFLHFIRTLIHLLHTNKVEENIEEGQDDDSKYYPILMNHVVTPSFIKIK